MTIRKERLNDLVARYNDGTIDHADYEELGRMLYSLASMVVSRRDILTLLDPSLEKGDLVNDLVLHMLTNMDKVVNGNAYAYLYGMCLFKLGVRLHNFKQRQAARVQNMDKIRANFGASLSEEERE